MAKPLKYTLSQPVLMSCASKQTLPLRKIKSGVINMTVGTEFGEHEGNDSALIATVKVRIAGIEHDGPDGGQDEAFFVECVYQHEAAFGEKAPDVSKMDAETGDRLLRPLYFLATTHCQDLAWRMGHIVPRTIPEAELLKAVGAPEKLKSTRKRKSTPA